MSAAVGDYRPLEYSNQKIKKKADEFYLKLGKTKIFYLILENIKQNKLFVGLLWKQKCY